MSNVKSCAENDVFKFQLVQCFYPISGQYGHFPRCLYYVLVVVSVVSSVFYREVNWIATIAAGSVMTYSGVAAVHAVALFDTRHQLRAPGDQLYDDRLYDACNTRGVGSGLQCHSCHSWYSISGLASYPSLFKDLPEIRTQADTPSVEFLLLLIGLICALLNSEEYVKSQLFYQSPPQYRFCAVNYNGDTLPTMKSGLRFDVSSIPHNESWNSTIWNAFNVSYNDICVDPCFSAVSDLRSSPDIIVMDDTSYNFMLISYSLYVLLGSSAFFCLTIFLVKTLGWDGTLKDFKAQIKSKLKNFILFLWPTGHMKMFLLFRFADRRPLTNRRPSFKRWTIGNIAKVIGTFSLFIIDLCAIFISPFTLLVFAISAESIVWRYPMGENIQDVGQWGPLVSTVLIFIAAVTTEYGLFVSTFIAHVVATFSSSVSTSIAYVVATISCTGSRIIGLVVAKFRDRDSTVWQRLRPVSSEQVGVQYNEIRSTTNAAWG